MKKTPAIQRTSLPLSFRSSMQESNSSTKPSNLLPIAPIDMAVVGHRFIHERIQAGVIFLKGFASVDRMRGIIGRGFLTGGIKVSDLALGLVFNWVVDGSCAFPHVFAHSGFEELFELLTGRDVQQYELRV